MAENSRRFFLTLDAENADEVKHYKLFTIQQNKNDGSFYFFSPNFEKIKWLTIEIDIDGSPSIKVTDSNDDGKLSIHATGQAHINPNGSYDLVIKGNALKDSDLGKVYARHLFTALLAKPEIFEDNSRPYSRPSDIGIATNQLKPFAIMFWAIPKNFEGDLSFFAQLRYDDFETEQPGTGWGKIDFADHAIIWFAYRTKHMQLWPGVPCLSYHDGDAIPFLKPDGKGNCSIEFGKLVIRGTDKLLEIGLQLEPKIAESNS